jgi:hypothetical protein
MVITTIDSFVQVSGGKPVPVMHYGLDWFVALESLASRSLAREKRNGTHLLGLARRAILHVAVQIATTEQATKHTACLLRTWPANQSPDYCIRQVGPASC